MMLHYLDFIIIFKDIISKKKLHLRTWNVTAKYEAPAQHLFGLPRQHLTDFLTELTEVQHVLFSKEFTTFFCNNMHIKLSKYYNIIQSL